MSYERAVEQHETDRLTYYTQRSNQSQDQQESEKLFVNLSLVEIIQGMSRTFIAIINDIVAGEVRSPSQLVIALFKGDRMMYIGTLLVLCAFAMYVVDITG